MEDYIEAHYYCYDNRDQLAKDEKCGCFECLRIFSPTEIHHWVNPIDNRNTTALCPYCGMDTVIGENCGFPLTEELLRKMRYYWMEKEPELTAQELEHWNRMVEASKRILETEETGGAFMKWNNQDVVTNEIDTFLEMPWDEYLHFLYEKTAEDGKLLVGVKDEDPFDENYGRVRIYQCVMDRDDEKLGSMMESLRTMMDELRALSKYWNELHDEDTDEEELLRGTDSYEAWKKYLKPLPDVEMITAAAEERVGEGINAYGVLYRARRMCHLYALDAKPVMIAHEERNLAQAYALHTCCKSMECVGKMEAEKEE